MFNRRVLLLLFCLQGQLAKSLPLTEKKNPLYQSMANNFYEVDKNKLFRSKQLCVKKLSHYIKMFNIKTIINLRGKNEKALWWQMERALAEREKITFYNIPMSANRLPHKQDIIKLLKIYRSAPRPILIHCLGGADRTGEAAALWVLDQQKKGKKEALKQLSIRYGHIEIKNPSKRFFIKHWQGINAYNPQIYKKHYGVAK